MKITAIRVRHIDESLWGYLAEREKTLPLVTPLDVYVQFKETRGSWFWDSGTALVEIETDAGVTGRGWCEDGCRAIGPIVDNHLSRLLIDQDPSETEGLWDRMFRASTPYGRQGLAMMAISAIDIALWDLRGRATGKPVYELLGGPVRNTIPVYASALHPVGDREVRDEARTYVEAGYTTMKARFPFGPGDGVAGMAANEAHIRSIRETIGDDIDLAADCYMGWDLQYAVRMCQRLEPYRMAWVEEPFLPDDLRSYARLRRETSIPISGGEHEFSRFGFQQIIDAEAMDILQPDLRRCGGFTEGLKIAALASTAGLPVIPHAYGATHLHFVAATPNAPLAEYFPLPCWATPAGPSHRHMFLDEPVPVGGNVAVSNEPGLGVRLNPEC
ncbi:MAG: enolase C-terminal domain-like protein [Pirellulaceae bacterium]|jgi:L-alanine-DL-glutamate epimerase-like enolase superfamily enzyme|nr:enolase C-terminal domain-like protein [Pirellulaceae bacterium]MDP7014855.1 enolase C-terminal domain-like protein [Pirellulaceae bacterium]